MNIRLLLMNTRLINAYQTMPGGVAFVSCKCGSAHPTAMVCAMCTPPDPLDPAIGMPVLADDGQGFYPATIHAVGLGYFEAVLGNVLRVQYYDQDWLVAVVPDYGPRWDAYISIGAAALIIASTSPACACGYPNEYNNPNNHGNKWRCTQCRLIQEMMG